MVKLRSPSEVDVDSIVRLTVDELSAEDRQAYKPSSRIAKRRTNGAKRKRSKRSVGGSYLTSLGTGRVKSPRTRRWSFFRMKKNKPKQIIM